MAIDFASGANGSALTVSGSSDNANVTFDLSSSTQGNTVTLGGGQNTVNLGTGADTVTFGAHSLDTTTGTGYDTVVLKAGTAVNNNAAANQPSVLTGNMAVLSGLVSGDVINLTPAALRHLHWLVRVCWQPRRT